MLEQIEKDFRSALETCADEAALQKLKTDFLGKKGALSEVLAKLKDLAPEERKDVGKKANVLKSEFAATLKGRAEELERERINKKLEAQWIDPSLRSSIKECGLDAGGYHPLEIVQREIEDFFLSMGFNILDGPHIEDEHHNFDALNMPHDHPSRDMQDTFWFGDAVHLLRTQTSPVQIRGMEANKPPFRFLAPGKVFRNERTDATHESIFHQVEGMYVDKNVSVGNLLYFAKMLFSHVFKRDVELRVRPSYFPFVEPGIEIDCSSDRGWMELMGAGMVHPNVLRAGGIDPEEYSGFAFGLGLDRLAMIRFGIDNVRLIHSADLRFSEQFRSI